MIRFLSILSLVLVSCAPSGWVAEKPASYQHSAIFLPDIESSKVISRSDALSSNVLSAFAESEADSVLALLVTRTLRVPDPRFAQARVVSSYAESDYTIRITGIDIRESINPLQKLVKNGPVVVVKVSADVFRGEELVYQSTTSDFANLAALASKEPGYHKASESERNDPALQRAMLLDAYYSAVGEMMMSFFQVNRY
jgi:hypothetical protein